MSLRKIPFLIFTLCGIALSQTYSIESVNLPAHPTLVVKYATTNGQVPTEFFHKTYAEIGTYAGMHGLTPVLPPLARFLKYEPPVIELEAGFAIDKVDAGQGEIRPSIFPAGSYAKTLHLGPYEKMSAAYDALNQWLKDNKKQMNGPAVEVYINNPSEVKPEDLRTEIYAPYK